jgi:hypothetical protein
VGEYLKKEEKQALPVYKKPSPLLWHRLGLLANTVGFTTKEIKDLKEKNLDTKAVYIALLEAWDSNYFTYNKSLVLRHLRRIKRIFNTVIKKPDLGG